jgi:hypothetical protein
LVKTGADGEKPSIDVATINRPDDLVEIANWGLTLAEGKLLLAGLQQEIVAAQARDHAVRRPDCRSCGVVCCVKDYRKEKRSMRRMIASVMPPSPYLVWCSHAATVGA